MPFNQQGKVNTGALYIIVILGILFGMAYLITGPAPTQDQVNTGTQVVIGNAQSEQAKERLQLYTFGAATITPPMDSVCKAGGINARPEIIIHTVPRNAQAISIESQIKVWVNDDSPPMVAPNEKITRNSGAIISPGDRTALGPDAQYLEPALYIFPNTADKGGQPNWPIAIRGDYNNGQIRLAYGIEQVPADIKLTYHYTSEYVWNIKDLGLEAGSYQLQFVVTDGKGLHGVKCVTTRIYEKTDNGFLPQ